MSALFKYINHHSVNASENSFKYKSVTSDREYNKKCLGKKNLSQKDNFEPVLTMQFCAIEQEEIFVAFPNGRKMKGEQNEIRRNKKLKSFLMYCVKLHHIRDPISCCVYLYGKI